MVKEEGGPTITPRRFRPSEIRRRKFLRLEFQAAGKFQNTPTQKLGFLHADCRHPCAPPYPRKHSQKETARKQSGWCLVYGTAQTLPRPHSHNSKSSRCLRRHPIVLPVLPRRVVVASPSLRTTGEASQKHHRTRDAFPSTPGYSCCFRRRTRATFSLESHAEMHPGQKRNDTCHAAVLPTLSVLNSAVYTRGRQPYTEPQTQTRSWKKKKEISTETMPPLRREEQLRLLRVALGGLVALYHMSDDELPGAGIGRGDAVGMEELEDWVGVSRILEEHQIPVANDEETARRGRKMHKENKEAEGET